MFGLCLERSTNCILRRKCGGRWCDPAFPRRGSSCYLEGVSRTLSITPHSPGHSALLLREAVLPPLGLLGPMDFPLCSLASWWPWCLPLCPLLSAPWRLLFPASLQIL